MTLSSKAINRISIDNLPSATMLQDEDYLLLQSNGVSSKIQIKDIRFDRANLTFYNEIVDLNKLTANHSQSIIELQNKIGSTAPDNNSDDIQNQSETSSPDKITSLEEKLASTESQLTEISDQIQTSDNTNQSAIKATNTKISQVDSDLKELTSTTGTNIAQMSQDYTEFVAGIEIRVQQLESRVAALEQTNSKILERLDSLE